MNNKIADLLARATAARTSLFDTRHESAFRLFNGFTEGWPSLAVDLYAQTLVLHDYSERPDPSSAIVSAARQFYQSRLPWISAVLLKTRNAETAEARNGVLLAGEKLATKIHENGAWYSVALQLNRDASFYLDTRNLRSWIRKNLGGQRVLNTFAYTGSLGVAAMAAGASRVVHLDLNRSFLNVAKTSYTLNGFPINKADFQSGDFWPLISRMIRARELFDCVFLDPPFFASTGKGMVDAKNNYARLINKVRPLIADEGRLVAVNNALFASGSEFMKTLKALCADGYLTIEELIPVAEDFTGDETTRVASNLPDPAPFNHSTKIAVLRVRRKDVLV